MLLLVPFRVLNRWGAVRVGLLAPIPACTSSVSPTIFHILNFLLSFYLKKGFHQTRWSLSSLPAVSSVAQWSSWALLGRQQAGSLKMHSSGISTPLTSCPGRQQGLPRDRQNAGRWFPGSSCSPPGGAGTCADHWEGLQRFNTLLSVAHVRGDSSVLTSISLSLLTSF